MQPGLTHTCQMGSGRRCLVTWHRQGRRPRRSWQEAYLQGVCIVGTQEKSVGSQAAALSPLPTGARARGCCVLLCARQPCSCCPILAGAAAGEVQVQPRRAAGGPRRGSACAGRALEGLGGALPSVQYVGSLSGGGGAAECSQYLALSCACRAAAPLQVHCLSDFSTAAIVHRYPQERVSDDGWGSWRVGNRMGSLSTGQAVIGPQQCSTIRLGQPACTIHKPTLPARPPLQSTRWALLKKGSVLKFASALPMGKWRAVSECAQDLERQKAAFFKVGRASGRGWDVGGACGGSVHRTWTGRKLPLSRQAVPLRATSRGRQ